MTVVSMTRSCLPGFSQRSSSKPWSRIISDCAAQPIGCWATFALLFPGQCPAMSFAHSSAIQHCTVHDAT
jgi:hypothetical protein